MVLKLRSDFDAVEVRRLARHSNDANQARRLLSLALIYDGHSRTEAAKTGGVGLQIIRKRCSGGTCHLTVSDVLGAPVI